MSTQRTTSPLQGAALSRRVGALFKAMAHDYLLREQFITDPAQILSEYIHGAKLPREEASASNQLLYAVMSNPALLRWLRGYIARHRGIAPPQARLMDDFAGAIIEAKARHAIQALIRGSVEQQAVIALDGAVWRVIFAAGIFSGGNRDGDPATDTTPTDVATDTTPTDVATDTTPTDVATDTTPTDVATDTTPTDVATDTTPTDVATDTTDQTSRGGFFGSGQWAVTLQALADYSTHLRDIGALDAVRRE